MKIGQRIAKIIRILRRTYGARPPLRKSDPIDEIVRTILSQNTNDTNSLRAFAVLKKNFRSWEGLLVAKKRLVSGLIKSAGLANIKAGRIKGVLQEIKEREGRLNLNRLNKQTPADSLAYLRSLKGIGPKTAACVLLFSFGMPVMPVDTHIFRVSKRLGFIAADTGIEGAHEKLQGIVPGRLIYEFHLGIIEHGRRTCRAQNPRCGFCVLYPLCRYKSKAIFKKKG